MEQFTLLEGDHTLKESRELINNALLTVRSLSAGDAFPTDNLSDGMLCYRTDLKRLYCLADAESEVWTDKLPADLGGTADAVPWTGITDKPTAYPAADHTHLYAGASDSGGAAISADKLTTARTINAVAFDGTADIAIDVGIKTVNSAAPDATGNISIAAVPTGTVLAFAANTDPAGYLLCNGAAISRTTYAALFAAIGTTYGAGDGSATFNLPNLANRFLMGHGTAGTVKAAGLPNIKGYATQFRAQNGTAHTYGGAFYSGNSELGTNQARADTANTAEGYYDDDFCFSAAKSNAIYGASTTVQPPAVTMRFYIKY